MFNNSNYILHHLSSALFIHRYLHHSQPSLLRTSDKSQEAPFTSTNIRDPQKRINHVHTYTYIHIHYYLLVFHFNINLRHCCYETTVANTTNDTRGPTTILSLLVKTFTAPVLSFPVNILERVEQNLGQR